MIPRRPLVHVLVLSAAAVAVLIGCATSRLAPQLSPGSSVASSEKPTPIDTVDTMAVDTELEISIAMIAASPERRASIPDRILETAAVDGVLYYVVFGSQPTDRIETGIPQDRIIGLLREPALGLVEGNLVGNPCSWN